MNQDILNMIIKIILAVITVIITRYVIPWIQSKTNSAKYSELMVFIEKCVEAAEKIYTPEEWEKKKAYVLELATVKLADIGIKISTTELNALIEGFVHEVKK